MPDPDLAAQIAAVRAALGRAKFSSAPDGKHWDALSAALRTLEALADREILAMALRDVPMRIGASYPTAKSDLGWTGCADVFVAAFLARAGGGE